jgi:hypothetical protein
MPSYGLALFSLHPAEEHEKNFILHLMPHLAFPRALRAFQPDTPPLVYISLTFFYFITTCIRIKFDYTVTSKGLYHAAPESRTAQQASQNAKALPKK